MLITELLHYGQLAVDTMLVIDSGEVLPGNTPSIVLLMNYCKLCANYNILHTQRWWAFDAQQLRVVLIRCGGSEKNRRSLLSDAYGYGTFFLWLVYLN